MLWLQPATLAAGKHYTKAVLLVLSKSAPSLLGFPSCVSSKLTNQALLQSQTSNFSLKTSVRGRGRQDATATFQLLSQSGRSHLLDCSKPIKQVSIQGEHGAPIEKCTAARRLF